ncbi:hypothetical protein SETIT_4G211300v2 [Setaria italica]|uniref:Uncharacterized protein n=2 Tax=Setaria TaxID=4554 RepID=A0A368QWN6_SETIT|nr:hypothetical protein SETIT_4G211300v2 [Setaria italica]TKW22304.1 hypothetical protein SEVIR_4G220700v2 [Setaria viridis]
MTAAVCLILPFFSKNNTMAPWAPSHGHQVDGCAVTRPISNMYSTCVPPNIST